MTLFLIITYTKTLFIIICIIILYFKKMYNKNGNINLFIFVSK